MILLKNAKIFFILKNYIRFNNLNPNLNVADAQKNELTNFASEMFQSVHVLLTPYVFVAERYSKFNQCYNRK